MTNEDTVTPTIGEMNTPGVYRFTLTVTDNQGATASDEKLVTVISAPDLSPAISINPSSDEADIDPVAGTYDNVRTTIVMNNATNGAVPAGSDIPYESVLDLNNDGTGDDTQTDSYPNAIAPNGSSATLVQRFDGVPFGTHEICTTINDPASSAFTEADYSDNEMCAVFTLDVPQPDAELRPTQALIQRGEMTDITFTIETEYELNCTLEGLGVNASFTTVPTDSTHTSGNTYEGSYQTATLNNTTNYVLECVEPTTSTTFTEEAVVDVVPSYEEI
jgi:hypothetical protein